jgi:hypothetical protein
MTLPQFWAMIFGKQIVWDERARGRDKLAQRWVRRIRFSGTHLGLANLAQLMINAVTVQMKYYFTSPVIQQISSYHRARLDLPIGTVVWSPQMWHTLPRRLRGPISSKATSFLFVVVLLSLPLLLPRFAGHRPAWLLLVIVLATISFALSIVFTWLTEKIAGLGGRRIENHPIATVVSGLIVCCLIVAATLHYAALPSDTVFMIVVIPGLVAIWFAFKHWHTLFMTVADKFHWGARTCAVIACSILAIGVALQAFLGRHNGMLALLICIVVALGCSATRFPPTTQTRSW